MKKHLIVFVSIFVIAIMSFASVSKAQDGGSTGASVIAQMPTSPNAIYLELLGNGLIYTVNYDRLLSPNTGIRVGVGYIGISGGTDANGNSVSASLLTIPATFNYFVGSTDARGKVGSSKLELGIGIVYVNAGASFGGASATGSSVGFTGTIGYRLQPSDGGFVFRIGFTPIDVLSHFFPYGGLSLGLAF